MKISTIVMCLATSGCAAPMVTGFKRVEIGMTKAEVIKTAGEPDSVAAHGGTEFLNYRLATSFADFDGSDTSDYYVKLVGGKVESYGRKGDFGTTAPSRMVIDHNQNIKIDQTIRQEK